MAGSEMEHVNFSIQSLSLALLHVGFLGNIVYSHGFGESFAKERKLSVSRCSSGAEHGRSYEKSIST